MRLPVRVKTRRLDHTILSIYKRGGEYVPMSKLKGGILVEETAEAVEELALAISGLGGRLYLSDGDRSIDFQAKERRKYDRWVAAGKPAKGSAGWEDSMRTVFVARAGRSFHNAGRAIDFWIDGLGFPDVELTEYLDVVWKLMEPFGWTPAIKARDIDGDGDLDPDESAKEAWHLDHKGPWQSVYDRLGYAPAAMCAVLDAGRGGDVFPRAWPRWVQAQLHRVGADVGDVDGYWGKTTKAAAAVVGLKLDADKIPLATALMAMPSQATAIFVP